MQEFFAELTTPKWWLSVVAISLLINLFSAYLKSWIDRFLSRISIKFRGRTAARRKAHEETVAALAADTVLLQFRCFQAVFNLLTATFAIVASALTIASAPLFLRPALAAISWLYLVMFVLALLCVAIALVLQERGLRFFVEAKAAIRQRGPLPD